MTITEICHLPLKVGIKPEDPSTPEGQLFQKTTSVLKSQPGIEAVYHSRKVEDEDQAVLFIEWNKIEDHKAFMAQPHYKDFLATLAPLLGGAPNFFHIPFQPYPTVQLANGLPPVFEVFKVFFAADFPQREADAFSGVVEWFASNVASNAQGWKGATIGWSVENDVAIPGATGSEVGRVFTGIFGWDAVADHNAFKETTPYKENVDKLKTPGIKFLDVFHVALTKA